MAYDLASITTGKGLQAPRVVLLGVEKIGKSECAAGADRSIFIPIHGEDGIDSIEVSQFPTCHQFKDVMECIGTIYREDHWGTTVIDSATTLEPLIHANTCARNPLPSKNGTPPTSIEQVGGGWAKGYTEALTDWRMLTDALDLLRTEKNMASIIIGHVKVKRFDDPAGPSYDQYQFDLNEKAANLLYRWSDLILFCNKKVAVVKEDVGFGKDVKRGVDISGGQRYMYTLKMPSHPGGGRGVYGRLPYELPLSWAALQTAVSAQLTMEASQ